MRPIKLALENFGPYRERAEIDFSALGEFFLICGKTGSGKSTLFDAITYALFGQAPGARKGSESEFVSDFSKPGDAPRVEFEKGDIVRVTQGPFAEFTGKIDEVMIDKQKLRVLIELFGRDTPVELAFNEVDKEIADPSRKH